MEALIEAAELLPGGAADEEAGAGGLDVFGRQRGVEVEGAVAPVDGVGGAEAVEAEGLKDEGGGSGQAAELEAELRGAGGREEQAGGGGGAGGILELVPENRGGRDELRVGVEQEHGLRSGEGGEALIDGGGEAGVKGIGDEGDAGA
jgi:hypothetical protein